MNIPIINNTKSFHLKLNKMIVDTRYIYVLNKNTSNLNSYVKPEINNKNIVRNTYYIYIRTTYIWYSLIIVKRLKKNLKCLIKCGYRSAEY